MEQFSLTRLRIVLKNGTNIHTKHKTLWGVFITSNYELELSYSISKLNNNEWRSQGHYQKFDHITCAEDQFSPQKTSKKVKNFFRDNEIEEVLSFYY